MKTEAGWKFVDEEAERRAGGQRRQHRRTRDVQA